MVSEEQISESLTPVAAALTGFKPLQGLYLDWGLPPHYGRVFTLWTLPLPEAFF